MSSDSIEKSSDGPRSFWGRVAGIAVGVPTSYACGAAGVVNGAISAASGHGFVEGFERSIDFWADMKEKAEKWGDENGEFLTKTAISAAVTLATGRIATHHGNSGSGVSE